jgi:hypothetical protein
MARSRMATRRRPGSRSPAVPGRRRMHGPVSIVAHAGRVSCSRARRASMLLDAIVRSYVGAPVEAYNAQSVRRATLMPDRTQVVFLTDRGKTLLLRLLLRPVVDVHEPRRARRGRHRRDATTTCAPIAACSRDAGPTPTPAARSRCAFETAWIHIRRASCRDGSGSGISCCSERACLRTSSASRIARTTRTSGRRCSGSTPRGDSSSDGWITGDQANTIGEEALDGTAYGDGVYGADAYGGSASAIYQWRLGLHANGQSIRFRFEDFEKYGLAGASFELTEMVVTGGVLAPTVRPFSTARSR